MHDALMARRQVNVPEEIMQRLEDAIDLENVRRAGKGLVALSGTDLMRIVLSRFVQLPVTHDVDLAAVRETKDGFWKAPKSEPKSTKWRLKTTTKKAPTKGRKVEQKT